MKKRLRRPKVHEGELVMYWGREYPRAHPEIMYAYSDRSMKEDVRFIIYALNARRPDPYADPSLGKLLPSFFQELYNRGYDLTTIRFSIKKHSTEET